MANIIFIDIPPLERILEDSFNDILQSKYKAQDIIYVKKGLKYPFQRKNKNFSRGLLTIGSYLKNRNHNINYTTSEEQFLKSIKDGDYVGIPTITPYMNIVKKIVRDVKKEKDVKVVLGGYHSNFLPKETFSEIPEADFIIHGEGEQPFADLLEGNLIAPGISINSQTQPIIATQHSLLPSDKIPNPDYSLLPRSLSNYNFNIQTARGCQYRCNFCVNGFFWGNPRYTHLDKVEEELVFLNSILPKGTFIHFSDNIFTTPKERAIQICDIIIKNNISFQFSCDSRGGHIDKELVKKMEKANFRRICFGFEDADNSVLNYNKGKITFEENIMAAQIVRKNSDIAIEAYWMIGLPNTTYQSMFTNLTRAEQLISENIVDTIATSTIYTPLPGSPIFENPALFGLNIETKVWDAYIRHNYKPVFSLPNLNQNQLMSYALLFESTLLNAYCNKLGISEKELSKIHSEMLLNGKI